MAFKRTYNARLHVVTKILWVVDMWGLGGVNFHLIMKLQVTLIYFASIKNDSGTLFYSHNAHTKNILEHFYDDKIISIKVLNV